jgi:hypothetical protein
MALGRRVTGACRPEHWATGRGCGDTGAGTVARVLKRYETYVNFLGEETRVESVDRH